MTESSEFTTSHVELRGGGGGEQTIEVRQIASEHFGCFIWPSAVFLAQYIFENPQLVRGKKVLELGAGVGLPGLACGKLGASRVVLTDLSKPAKILHNLQHNCCANGLPNCSASPLDWGMVTGEPHQMASMCQTGYDVLLAADCLYSSSLYDDFLCTASYFLRRSPVLLARRTKWEMTWEQEQLREQRHLQDEDEQGKQQGGSPARAGGPRLFTVLQLGAGAGLGVWSCSGDEKVEAEVRGGRIFALLLDLGRCGWDERPGELTWGQVNGEEFSEGGHELHLLEIWHDEEESVR
eukprot:587452-Hanusia_phi.AAC.7